MAQEERARSIFLWVRQYRALRGLALHELARRSGAAKSTIAQIEAGTASPTISTLETLAEALSVTLEDLIAPPPEAAAMVVVRQGEGLDISDDAIRGFLVAKAQVAPATLEFHSLVLQAGKSQTSASHGAAAQDHVIVTAGRVLAGPINGPPRELTAGDYAHYPADQPHLWSAQGGDAHVWLVAVFPRPQEG